VDLGRGVRLLVELRGLVVGVRSRGIDGDGGFETDVGGGRWREECELEGDGDAFMVVEEAVDCVTEWIYCYCFCDCYRIGPENHAESGGDGGGDSQRQFP
jgi:hypothetical protein